MYKNQNVLNKKNRVAGSLRLKHIFAAVGNGGSRTLFCSFLKVEEKLQLLITDNIRFTKIGRLVLFKVARVAIVHYFGPEWRLEPLLGHVAPVGDRDEPAVSLDFLDALVEILLPLICDRRLVREFRCGGRRFV